MDVSALLAQLLPHPPNHGPRPVLVVSDTEDDELGRTRPLSSDHFMARLGSISLREPVRCVLSHTEFIKCNEILEGFHSLWCYERLFGLETQVRTTKEVINLSKVWLPDARASNDTGEMRCRASEDFQLLRALKG